MPYTPLEWKDGPEGGTPISAANLNRMEQGIKAAHDLADPATRFQVSGCVGGNTNIVLPSNTSYGMQIISVAVPSGKSLILKRARFEMAVDYLRLSIVTGVAPFLNNIWTSQSPRGDVALNVVVSNENPLVPVWIQVFNPTANSVNLPPEAGWWLDFAIVDA